MKNMPKGKQRSALQKISSLLPESKTSNRKKDEKSGARFAMSQVVTNNPILLDTLEYRRMYFEKLKEYTKLLGRENGLFEAAELDMYQKIMLRGDNGTPQKDFRMYRYYLLIDVIFILGCKLTESEAKSLLKKYREEFSENRENARTASELLKAFTRTPARLEGLIKNKELQDEWKYLLLLRKNSRFQMQKSYTILVTATMSAGKSTFINALAGKKICRSQIAACTSKIHTIYNKAFEDGLAYEYDHDLLLAASEDNLMNDNEKNESDQITVAVKFKGGLRDDRIIISDSPGVNFSGAVEHREITRKMIEQKNFDLLIYVMNATQMATDDEAEHLRFIRNKIGKTPVLFVLNKVDELDPEKEGVQQTLKEMHGYLEDMGFRNPMICPVSAWMGGMAKRSEKETLTHREKMRMDAYADLLEEMNLPEYYEKEYPCLSGSRENSKMENMLRISGIPYIEKIILLASARRK